MNNETERRIDEAIARVYAKYGPDLRAFFRDVMKEDAQPSPGPVAAAGKPAYDASKGQLVCPHCDQDCGGFCEPGDSRYVDRKPATPPETASAPRRMMANPSCAATNSRCLHSVEHDEVHDEQHPEPDYQDFCAYHGCKPVPPQATEGKKAGQRWIAEESMDGAWAITTKGDVKAKVQLLRELPVINRARLQELEFIFEGGAKRVVPGCKAGIAAVLRACDLEVED